MILSFASKAASDTFHGFDTKDARRIPRNLWDRTARKLDMLNAAVSIEDLKVPPGNRLEMLRANMKGHYSIRVNQQRPIFPHST